MSTFIGQLVGFAVIVWLVWRYVVPPVRKLMADQQNTVRQQLDDSSAAADRLAEAEPRPREGEGRRQGRGAADHRRGAGRCQAHRRTTACPGRQSTRSGSSSRAPSRPSCCVPNWSVSCVRTSVPNPSGGQANWCAATSPTRASSRRPSTVSWTISTRWRPPTAEVQYPVATKMRSASRLALTGLLDKFGEIADGLDDQGLVDARR